MPTGMLMKNTQRQPGPSVSRPLAITPTEAAPPPTAPKMPKRPVPLLTLGEGDGNDRQGRRRDEGGAESLEPSRRDEKRGRLGDSRDERGGREDGHPGDQDPSSPEQVGHPAPEQQESAEQ